MESSEQEGLVINIAMENLNIYAQKPEDSPTLLLVV